LFERRRRKREDNSGMDLKETETGLGKKPLLGSCGHGNEPSVLTCQYLGIK
jgi:hypothetical protein